MGYYYKGWSVTASKFQQKTNKKDVGNDQAASYKNTVLLHAIVEDMHPLLPQEPFNQQPTNS